MAALAFTKKWNDIFSTTTIPPQVAIIGANSDTMGEWLNIVQSIQLPFALVLSPSSLPLPFHCAERK
jgi:hypothetical protein